MENPRKLKALASTIMDCRAQAAEAMSELARLVDEKEIDGVTKNNYTAQMRTYVHEDLGAKTCRRWMSAGRLFRKFPEWKTAYSRNNLSLEKCVRASSYVISSSNAISQKCLKKAISTSFDDFCEFLDELKKS